MCPAYTSAELSISVIGVRGIAWIWVWDSRDRMSTGEYIRVSVNFEYYYRIIIKTVLLCDWMVLLYIIVEGTLRLVLHQMLPAPMPYLLLDPLGASQRLASVACQWVA